MYYSVADELLKLKQLLDENILTQDEFESEKQAILSRKTKQPRVNHDDAKDTYTVILNSFPEKSRRIILKVIRTAYEGNDNYIASLASRLPLIIKSDIDEEFAQSISERLGAMGCDVSVRNYKEGDGAVGKQADIDVNTDTEIICPYCHSTNVEKITLGKRVVKGYLWGAAAANTLVKEWHCKNCKSNF